MDIILICSQTFHSTTLLGTHSLTRVGMWNIVSSSSYRKLTTLQM